MEKNEISLHQVKIYRFVQRGKTWFTSQEVSDGAGVAPSTARHHLLHFVQLGIFDQAEMYPAHRYRFASKADKRNLGYLIRLENACEIFGL